MSLFSKRTSGYWGAFEVEFYVVKVSLFCDHIFRFLATVVRFKQSITVKDSEKCAAVVFDDNNPASTTTTITVILHILLESKRKT